jgi:hypothetical protein
MQEGKYVVSNLLGRHHKFLSNLLGIDHPQGQGKLEKMSCQVIFNIFRPVDLQSTPFIIWVSTGRHTHPPPPPSRSPRQYLNEILKVIQQMRDQDLISSTLFLIACYCIGDMLIIY